ncbi:hypothetical protein [Clostridium sp. LIBA-8841]|nr:hypothetical protein [Clostridium sp. LIBA-8841]MDZ5253779.1 hypothetical protein [Clostridium sp. LIBA-8841]
MENLCIRRFKNEDAAKVSELVRRNSLEFNIKTILKRRWRN